MWVAIAWKVGTVIQIHNINHKSMYNRATYNQSKEKTNENWEEMRQKLNDPSTFKSICVVWADNWFLSSWQWCWWWQGRPTYNKRTCFNNQSRSVKLVLNVQLRYFFLAGAYMSLSLDKYQTATRTQRWDEISTSKFCKLVLVSKLFHTTSKWHSLSESLKLMLTTLSHIDVHVFKCRPTTGRQCVCFMCRVVSDHLMLQSQRKLQ